MQYVWNAHSGRVANKASEDGALLQEHGYEAKAEGCGGRESVCGDEIKTGREGGIRDN